MRVFYGDASQGQKWTLTSGNLIDQPQWVTVAAALWSDKYFPNLRIHAVVYGMTQVANRAVYDSMKLWPRERTFISPTTCLAVKFGTTSSRPLPLFDKINGDCNGASGKGPPEQRRTAAGGPRPNFPWPDHHYVSSKRP